MKKEEIIARLGKTARAVTMSENEFGIARAVFYIPMFESGNFRSFETTMRVDYYSAGSEKIGHAVLNIHLCQQSHIRVSKMLLSGKEYEIVEDISWLPGKVRPDVEIRGESSKLDESEEAMAMYGFLSQTYGILKGLSEDKITYEPEVNPQSYNWIADRHLDEEAML